jgi:hypothetical protein
VATARQWQDESVLVILIAESVNGPPARRLAAKYLLDCVRRSATRDEIAVCIDDLERQVLLDDVVTEARGMATALGLIE